MNDLWPRQLRLAHAFAAWTGTYRSIFLTKYAVPASSNVSHGIMMHYYGMAPWNGIPEERAATREALESMCAARGCDVAKMLQVMPQLLPLVRRGAVLASKPTGGAFSPDSELPAALDRYSPLQGAANTSSEAPWKTLVIAGVETDYCVLSTILGAIDRYYRVVLVTDAVASSQPNSAQAQLDYTLRRFDHMVDFTTTETLLTYLSR